MAPATDGHVPQGSTCSPSLNVKEYAANKLGKVSFTRFASSPFVDRKNGLPAVSFPQADLQHSAWDFSLTAILHFPAGRPSLPILRRFLHEARFLGDFVEGLLSSRALMVRFEEEDDLIKLLSRRTCFVRSFPYRICRWVAGSNLWTGEFLVPVWVHLPRLPLQFFHPDLLRAIASSFGKLLALDPSTATLARPSEARICVELDVRKAQPSSVWIGAENGSGFWQDLFFQRLPQFCGLCNRLGHQCSDPPPAKAPSPDPTGLAVVSAVAASTLTPSAPQAVAPIKGDPLAKGDPASLAPFPIVSALFGAPLASQDAPPAVAPAAPCAGSPNPAGHGPHPAAEVHSPNPNPTSFSSFATSSPPLTQAFGPPAVGAALLAAHPAQGTGPGAVAPSPGRSSGLGPFALGSAQSCAPVPAGQAGAAQPTSPSPSFQTLAAPPPVAAAPERTSLPQASGRAVPPPAQPSVSPRPPANLNPLAAPYPRPVALPPASGESHRHHPAGASTHMAAPSPRAAALPSHSGDYHRRQLGPADLPADPLPVTPPTPSGLTPVASLSPKPSSAGISAGRRRLSGQGQSSSFVDSCRDSDPARVVFNREDTSNFNYDDDICSYYPSRSEDQSMCMVRDADSGEMVEVGGNFFFHEQPVNAITEASLGFVYQTPRSASVRPPSDSENEFGVRHVSDVVSDSTVHEDFPPLTASLGYNLRPRRPFPGVKVKKRR